MRQNEKKIYSRRNFLKSAGSASLLIPSMKWGYSHGELKEKLVLSKSNIAKQDIDTPALLVDMDAFERNIKKMSEYSKKNNFSLRPHAKTHKCPEIAKRQISSGAIGICTAKVSEAEAMVDGGIKDVLITCPVITPYKINKLIELRKRTSGMMVVIDNKQNVKDLSETVLSNDLNLDVLVAINPGLGRIGVEPGQPAVALAKTVIKTAGLNFRGIQAYAGHVQHIKGFKERRKKSLEAMEPAAETKRILEREGIEVEFFSGGGTGTYNIDHEIPEFTDLQTGSYIFMGVQYQAIGGKDFSDDHYGDFEPSLTVLTTAISQPAQDSITTDAGTKALAMDSPKPIVKGITGVSYRIFGDEHGQISFDNPSQDIKWGDTLEVIVTHCDPTVNLYDYCYCIRNDKVEAIWKITARGKSQ